MKQPSYVEEQELAALAKQYRLAAGVSRAEAARNMDVKQAAIFYAEEKPEQSFTKLRRRMIEMYGKRKITGPLFRVETTE